MGKTLTNQIVAQKIKKIREIKNFTQDYLASELNISTKTYGLWESGQVKLNLDRINEIATVLEMDPLDLLNFNENIFFENCKNGVFGYVNSNNTINNISENERKLYEDLISSLKEQIKILKTNK